MNQEQKDILLSEAKHHVSNACSEIVQSAKDLADSIEKRKAEHQQVDPADKVIFNKILAFDQKRLYELEHLKSSPYFVKCTIKKEGSEKEETWFFGKFSHKDSSIFSWVTPAASIRFEKPGSFSFQTPDEKHVQGALVQKDQYMIVEGKILFLATESLEQERELVYQEHFSTHKTEFVLPEIVAQMEKAQDQVIRAHHEGPFVISGPAGSGKTTLALHRIAYLVQSPETTTEFVPEAIIVFVQDNGTKDYFSHLLPELGIRNVQITTFAEWALKILEIEGFSFEDRVGETEEQKNAMETAKLSALRNTQDPLPAYTKNTFKLLEHIYAPYLSDELSELLQKQKASLSLDRFDLTILLRAFLNTHDALSMTKDYYLERKDGALQKKVGRRPIGYSLVLMDEFQNYLPEQIKLIKSCKKDSPQSILYVGDIAQQVQTGTLREWSEVSETINDERIVSLRKVYRNTKEILSYISSLNYDVEIPNEVKSGEPVCEIILQTKDEEISYIKKLLEEKRDGETIGILARHKEYLEEFAKAFENDAQVKVFDIKESQGVEFDIVCLVGIGQGTFTSENGGVEAQRILKNLQYIALTRAMNELHILGKATLTKAQNEING